MLKAERIRIEHMIHPLGIDCTNPVISWNAAGGRRQGAYRVVAKGHLGTNYDSGRVESSNMSCQLPVTFQSREQVKVEIQLLEEGGNAFGEAESAGFEMGLLKPQDWKAQWIIPESPEWMYNTEKKERPASYLRKNFFVKSKGTARLYVTCHGIYNIYLNGRHVEGFVMAPGTSAYHKLLQYQTYDVADYLQEGENEILAILGNGWWRGTVTYDGKQNTFGSDVALLAQMEMNGEPLCMTDADWIATQEGSLRNTDNMAGEIYDARYEKNLADSANWHPVQVVAFGYDTLSCSNCPASIEQEQFHPTLINTPKGEQVLDFGQNIAGYIGFSVQGKEGDSYRFTHGETLDGEGNFCMDNFQSPNFWCAQEIVYTCKEGKNTYKPTNTFMGFRYVKVEGMEEIHPEEFTAYAVYTDLEQTATFTCGNHLVNQLFQNALWSLKGNLLDIPTDCPTREKSGFTGDLVTYVHTMLYLMDAYPMLQKFIRNQAKSQYEDGCVKQIVADPRERGWFDGAAGWCDSFEIVPDRVGLRYNDYGLFEKYYDEIKKWVDYSVERAAKETRPANLNNPYHSYLSDVGIHWGEWAEPGMEFQSYLANIVQNGEPEVATAYLSYACHLIARQAERMNKIEEQDYYDEVAENARKAYRYAFVKDGRIDSERMCRYIRPIALNILTEEEKLRAASDLNKLVINNSYKLNTGFLTTHELCRTLSDYGYIGTAYQLLLNTQCPGWLYAVENGATSIPENWQAYQSDGGRKDSFNHYSYGAIAGWLMDSVAGIRISDGVILLKPHPCKELGYAEASYQSPFGTIVSRWEYKDAEVHYHFEIPCNCRANICLPDGRIELLETGSFDFIQTIN